MFNKIVIIIPSLEPEEVLIKYVDILIKRGVKKLIIINDGSGEKHNFIFEHLESMSECTILTHRINKGKGAALKTGYGYIQKNIPDCQGIITVDSDGQHLVDDVCKVAHALEASCMQQLILGIRDFSLPNIPFKSKTGNRLTSAILFCLYGKWLPDTQTGLRGFDRSLLGDMLEVQGERFEYEMQVIIDCFSQGIPIKQVSIETIYESNNDGSHFHAVKDSLRVMKAVFGKFSRFLSVSLFSTVIDFCLAVILFDMLKGYVEYGLIRVSIAVAIARIASMFVNYILNKQFVFRVKKTKIEYSIKYFILCGINIIISSVFVFGVNITTGISEELAKIIISGILFFVNYQVQRLWVFRNK